MHRTAFKIAASTVMVAMTMTSVAAPSGAVRRYGERANAPSDREARQFYDQASRALQQGHLPEAMALMERAVAASPRDVGYRMLLADAYLRSGRFDSARATYAEAVQLDPSNNRGALSVALIHIAQGRPAAAVGILDNIADRAPAADVGLAYALAGRAERAVELLESAARSPMASPRTRQNLALAYAFAGDWGRARTIAAQDISPSEVDGRMAQWAQMARPGAGPVQVATLLGVSPGADTGRPLQVALGAVEPVVPGADRVQVAQAPAFQPAPAPAPRPTFVQPRIPVAAAVPRPAPHRAAYIRAAAITPLPRTAFNIGGQVRPGNAPVVVQLGAFTSEANAERAWQQVSARYGMAARRPLTTTFAHNGRTFHRVSVSGFASAADAQRLCGQIRNHGGLCFVRASAGDASIRWAARYANPRQRNV